MASGGGPYSRAELAVLNAGMDVPAVRIDEVVRVHRAELSRVLQWFAPKPMPETWAGRLTEAFAPDQRVIVAFGNPRGRPHFFVVHEEAMSTFVTCTLPDTRVVLARVDA